MKRPKRWDSLAGAGGGAMVSTTMCPSAIDEGLAYDRGGGNFSSIPDGLGEAEEEVAGDGDDLCSHGGGSVGLGKKKRRLNIEQVKALEKNFEVENKLEPERKVKLAQELGLQPRQVAVWFQNRRARWKTKQLERDYSSLKAEYDALKLNHDNLRHEHDDLLAEIKELKAKLAGGSHCHRPIKDECLGTAQVEPPEAEEEKERTKDVVVEENDDVSLPALIYKDGSSDSDTSVILNDDGGAAISSSSGIVSHPHQLKPHMLFVGFHCASPSSTLDGKVGGRPSCAYHHQQQQPEEPDTEENDFLHGSGSFFSDDQAPSLSWYCADQWSSDVRLLDI